MNLALNLQANQSSPTSPDRRTAGFNTPGKKDQKNAFPTTPRSVEKAKEDSASKTEASDGAQL